MKNIYFYIIGLFFIIIGFLSIVFIEFPSDLPLECTEFNYLCDPINPNIYKLPSVLIILLGINIILLKVSEN